MKKNNVAIDIISFGTDGSAIDLTIPSLATSSSAPAAAPETNETKLLALHEAVNSSDNSHYLAVEPGPHLLSERISASPILRGDSGDDDSGMGGGGGGGGGDDYGVDPNLDPELAMVRSKQSEPTLRALTPFNSELQALRMSLEEERARVAAASASTSAVTPLEAVPEVAASGAPALGAEVPVTPATTVKKEEDTTADDTAAILAAAGASEIEDVGMEGEEGDDDDDDDDDLARALALSRGDDVEMGDDAEDDEDAEIARASEYILIQVRNCDPGTDRPSLCPRQSR